MTTEGSSDLSTFLSQLPANIVKKVGESIVAPVMVATTKVGTFERVASQPKKRLVLMENCLPPPITLLEYTWID